MNRARLKVTFKSHPETADTPAFSVATINIESADYLHAITVDYFQHTKRVRAFWRGYVWAMGRKPMLREHEAPELCVRVAANALRGLDFARAQMKAAA